MLATLSNNKFRIQQIVVLGYFFNKKINAKKVIKVFSIQLYFKYIFSHFTKDVIY